MLFLPCSFLQLIEIEHVTPLRTVWTQQRIFLIWVSWFTDASVFAHQNSFLVSEWHFRGSLVHIGCCSPITHVSLVSVSRESLLKFNPLLFSCFLSCFFLLIPENNTYFLKHSMNMVFLRDLSYIHVYAVWSCSDDDTALQAGQLL